MQTGRRSLGLFVAIFLIACGVRVGLTARFQGLSSPPNLSANPDAGEYELITYNLSVGGGYGFRAGVPTTSRPPGTSLTLLPAYLIFGRSYLAAHWLVILLWSVTCLIVGWLATQYGGRHVGLLAALWLALYPGHAYYSMHFLSETVYGFWIALACALSFRSLARASPAAAITAGVAWGFTILTRVEMVTVIPLAWALLLVSGRDLKRRAFPILAAQTTVATVVVALWILRNVAVVGVPILSTQRGFAFWWAHNNVTFSDPTYAGSWLPIYERVRDT